MFRMKEVPAGDFLRVFQAARDSEPEIERHTVEVGPATLGRDYKCYLVQERGAETSMLNAGFIVEHVGKRRLRCMFNATGPATRTPRQKLGSFMVQEAIRLGARSLNCPADWREKLYRKHGFVEVNRLVFMELRGGTNGG